MLEKRPQILLFGRLRFCQAEGGSAPALSGAARELLAYLCVHRGKELRRERLADLFWPDLDQVRSRNALNTAVWRVNKSIKDEPELTLRSTPEVLALETGASVATDVEMFEAAVRRGLETWGQDPHLPADVRQELSGAVGHHSAPFLEGCNAEWAVVERERLSSLHLRGLAVLMQDRGLERDYEAALEYGLQILSADPFREQAQCEVMWLHVLNGQRAKALMQYRDYRALLQREMGIEPMAKMRALVAYIRNDPDAERRLSDQSLGGLSGRSFADILQSVSLSRLDTYRTLQTS
ncbi:MAG TPA: BTAD domain-containing putative transcriptional regulator [Beijerinckiaceae bacterium]|jgi:DNA-binding SARP family transcriptional activator